MHAPLFSPTPRGLWHRFLTLFVGGCALHLCSPAVFAQFPDTASPPPLHTLSDDQWLELSKRTQQALAPASTAPPANAQSSRDGARTSRDGAMANLAVKPIQSEPGEFEQLAKVTPFHRNAAYRDAVLRWCRSEDFAESQSEAWIEYHFATVSTEQDVVPWDHSLHTEWLQSSIAANEPFFRFLQKQLTADLDAPNPQAALPTASWFRARSWEPSLLDSADARRSSRPSASWYERAADSQRSQQLDLDRAIESIRKTEWKDWRRLLVAPTVPNWHAQHAEPPIPPESELIAQWPDSLSIHASGESAIGHQASWIDGTGSDTLANPLRIGGGHVATALAMTPLGLSSEWTLVWNVHFEEEATEPFDNPRSWLLFAQYPDTSYPGTHYPDPRNAEMDRNRSGTEELPPGHAYSLPHGIAVAMHQGRLRCSLKHDAPFSAIEVESLDEIPRQDRHQLAVVYDGTRSASGLRIALDGQLLETRVVADRIARDIVFPSPTRWRLGDPEARNIVAAIEDFQGYRIALSEPELNALNQSLTWKPWDECSERERLGWVEYVARRVDLDWRYQRESLLYYLSNRARISGAIPIIPVMDGSASLDGWSLHPNRFPGSLLEPNDFRRHPTGVRWLGSRDRRELAIALLHDESWRDSIAANEVRRQWLALTHSLPGQPRSPTTDPGQRGTLDPMALRQWTEAFLDSGGDRRQLVWQIVSSPEWLAIALDSKP